MIGLAKVLGVDPYELFDADPQAPSLHDLRVRRGLSAKDLAVKAELLYEGLVYRLDLGRGPSEVPEVVLRKLAEVLGVDVEAVRDACLRSRERRPT